MVKAKPKKKSGNAAGPRARPEQWNKRSQQYGAVAGFASFMSFGVLFFEPYVPEGVSVIFKFSFFIASQEAFPEGQQPRSARV